MSKITLARGAVFSLHAIFGGICGGCGKPVLHIAQKDSKNPSEAAEKEFTDAVREYFQNPEIKHSKLCQEKSLEVCCPSCGCALERTRDVTVFGSYDEAMEWMFSALNIRRGDRYRFDGKNTFSVFNIRSKAYEKAPAGSRDSMVADAGSLSPTGVSVQGRVCVGKRCDKCGFENTSGSGYCIFCGTLLNTGNRLTGN